MSTPEIGLYPDATPDEQIAYAMGWNTARAIDRSEAFAAIRRAAEVARSVDRDIGDQSEWHDYELHSHGDDGWVPMPVVAEQIRRAIRAAIGSAKA